MRYFFVRYAFAVCVLGYMLGILGLHAMGVFPRAGLYNLSRLVGCSQVTVEGEVLDMPVLRWNQTRFLFQGRASPLEAFSGRMVVTLNFPLENLAPGDRIRIRGWPSAPRPATLRREFDESSYWATRGVYSMLKVWSPEGLAIVRPSSAWGISRRAWMFHRRYRAFWEEVLPPREAALLLGITIGARGVLPKDLKEDCIRAGVYHIVVVSGQNMSLIVSLGVGLLLLLQIPNRHALALCFLPILFYTAVVGADPPVMRAAVMAVVGLLTQALGRDIPRFYPLLLAAAWILTPSPEALLGASFQLSFGATLSLMAVLPLWDKVPSRRRSRWRRWIGEALLIGLAVHVGIGPLLVFYFHRLSLAGIVGNFTVFPLSGALMVAGLGVGTWGAMAPDTVPGWVLQGVSGLLRLTLWLIHLLGQGSWAVWPLNPPPGWAFLLYYGFLFGILFVVRRRKNDAQNDPTPQASLPRL